MAHSVVCREHVPGYDGGGRSAAMSGGDLSKQRGLSLAVAHGEILIKDFDEMKNFSKQKTEAMRAFAIQKEIIMHIKALRKLENELAKMNRGDIYEEMDDTSKSLWRNFQCCRIESLQHEKNLQRQEAHPCEKVANLLALYMSPISLLGLQLRGGSIYFQGKNGVFCISGDVHETRTEKNI